MTSRSRFTFTSLLVSSTLASAACVGGDGGPGGGEEFATWYAVATNVFLPDGVAGHVVGTATLDDEELTLADSVEIPGGGMVYSAGDSTLFVGQFGSPLFTKYDVAGDGSLSEVGQLSFQNFGLASSGFNPDNVWFIDADRAYILTEAAVIRFDPEALEIVDEFAMPDLERAGYTVGTGFTAFRRGDELVWTMQWGDGEGDRTLDEVALIRFDLTTETITSSTLTGCGGAVWGAEAENGDIVWSTGSFDTARFVLSDGERAAAPCLVRLPAGADALSPTIVDLGATVTDGRPAGSLWGVGGGKATLRVLEDGFVTDENTTAADLTFRTNWAWYSIDLETLALSPIAGLGENGGSVFLYKMGDRTMVPVIPVTEDQTTLFDVTDGQEPARALHTPGNVYAATRVR